MKPNYCANSLIRTDTTVIGAVCLSKYSGKELITFGGYDAMDYHARWRPTVVPLFTTPDPLGEKRPDLSIYTYCGSDPINATDPSGCVICTMSTEGTYIWRCIDNVWNFYNTEGVAYNGDDDFIIAAAGTLNYLMDGKNGRELVERIAADERYINIQRGKSNAFDKHNSAIMWDRHGNQGVYVENGNEDVNININLGHELAHADYEWNVSKEGIPEIVDFGFYKGVVYFLNASEVYTTHLENLIRSEHNLDLRTGYVIIDDGGFYSSLLPIIRQSEHTSIYYNANSQTTYKKLRRYEEPYKY